MDNKDMQSLIQQQLAQQRLNEDKKENNIVLVDQKNDKQNNIVKSTEIKPQAETHNVNNTNRTNTSNVEAIDNRLVIGQNENKKDIYISQTNRLLNTAIIGTKGTGKTNLILPYLIEQDLKNKNTGMTIIVSGREMSYNIYSLAKHYKRSIHFLKPSVSNEINNKFLWMKQYDYDYINEFIINYKEAIKRKDIVIIDMEVFKYKIESIKAVAMLLLQLRLDIQETDVTQRHYHCLYIDDAYYYLKFLEDLLIYGSNFNLAITLCIQSMDQLITKDKDYTSVFNSNVRNIILLNNIARNDYLYYKDLFTKSKFEDFFNREKNTLMYITLDRNNCLRCGTSRIRNGAPIDWDELERKSKRIRSKLLKEKRKSRKEALKSEYTNNILSSEPKPIDTDRLKDIVEDNVIPEPIIDKEIEQKINKQILEEEKEAKRKVATGIFNNYNKKIEFCDDLFTFLNEEEEL